MKKAMYEHYWNLACRPFEGHFSPAFFFDSETHQAARLKLRYLVENGLGTGVLCGGIGTGKTSVAAILQHDLADTCGPVAHLVFPRMPSASFLAYLASKLGAPEAADDARHGIDRTLTRIEAQLRHSSQQGRRPVIIVDEAHLIDDVRVFESLQLLLNFQQDPACSFSLFLVGGLNLLGRLERIPQLNERIAVRSVIEPLSLDETIGYVCASPPVSRSRPRDFPIGRGGSFARAVRGDSSPHQPSGRPRVGCGICRSTRNDRGRGNRSRRGGNAFRAGGVSDSSRRRDDALRTKHLPQTADFAPGNLPTERIDLWTVPLAAAPERTDALSEFLSADERARAARFKFDRDRRRYVVGRGTLREILAFYLGTHPGEIGFAYGEHGKPMLADRAASRDIEFNASGSQELAVCAVTVGRQVGVDIEFSGRPVDEALIRVCLSAAERRAYAMLSSEEKPAAFYRLWTLKEAYLKATGDGLSRKMSALEMTCLPGKPARLLADPLATAELGSWQFIEFAPAPGHSGALAVADGEPARSLPRTGRRPAGPETVRRGV